MESTQRIDAGFYGAETVSDRRTSSLPPIDRTFDMSSKTEVLSRPSERTVLIRGPQIPVGSGMKATLFEIYIPGSVKDFFGKLFGG